MLGEMIVWGSIRHTRKRIDEIAGDGDADDAWMVFMAVILCFVLVLPVLAPWLVYEWFTEHTGRRSRGLIAAGLTVWVGWMAYWLLGWLALWAWLFVVGLWWAGARRRQALERDAKEPVI